MTKNIIFIQKDSYTFSLCVMLPLLSVNKRSGLLNQKRTVFSFPTQIILTNGLDYISIELSLFGFGLVFYLRSRE